MNTWFNVLTPESHVRGDSVEDTRGLAQLAKKTRDYLSEFSWSKSVAELRLGYGVGGVIAVFAVRFCEATDAGDEYLWVVVGDLPSAYLVPDDLQKPRAVLECYCELMEDWARAVMGGRDLRDVFPVAAEPTYINAEQLLRRISYLRNSIIPLIKE